MPTTSRSKSKTMKDDRKIPGFPAAPKMDDSPIAVAGMYKIERVPESSLRYGDYSYWVVKARPTTRGILWWKKDAIDWVVLGSGDWSTLEALIHEDIEFDHYLERKRRDMAGAPAVNINLSISYDGKEIKIDDQTHKSEHYYRCTRCNGTGSIEMQRDLHRSGGIIPCSNCEKGIVRQYTSEQREGYDFDPKTRKAKVRKVKK